jgi:hypothetical protein
MKGGKNGDEEQKGDGEKRGVSPSTLQPTSATAY